MVYADDRNWDQEELDRARQVAKDNVVSDGASVPQAAKINNYGGEDSAQPSPVLEGDRATTEAEREVVEAEGSGANMTDGHETGNTEDSSEAAKAEFESDTKQTRKKS